MPGIRLSCSLTYPLPTSYTSNRPKLTCLKSDRIFFGLHTTKHLCCGLIPAMCLVVASDFTVPYACSRDTGAQRNTFNRQQTGNDILTNTNSYNRQEGQDKVCSVPVSLSLSLSVCLSLSLSPCLCLSVSTVLTLLTLTPPAHVPTLASTCLLPNTPQSRS